MSLQQVKKAIKAPLCIENAFMSIREGYSGGLAETIQNNASVISLHIAIVISISQVPCFSTWLILVP